MFWINGALYQWYSNIIIAGAFLFSMVTNPMCRPASTQLLQHLRGLMQIRIYKPIIQQCDTSYMKRTASFLIYLRYSALVLLASAVAVTNAAPAKAFNVRLFGAKGDGKTLDSPAINRAIEAAAKAGGGTVFFPVGTYLSGSIHLQSHITLYLDMGSTILGAPNGMNAYDAAELNPYDQFQDFGHDHWHNSLIWGQNLEQVAIAGQGSINGGGMTTGSNDVRVPDGDGNKSVALKFCRGVNLRDITMANGGHFAILLTGCDNVSIRNLKIDTDRDGMDINCLPQCPCLGLHGQFTQ